MQEMCCVVVLLSFYNDVTLLRQTLQFMISHIYLILILYYTYVHIRFIFVKINNNKNNALHLIRTHKVTS